tara:strand:- start:941 stop:1150 length:210 start_codon:yes stop_codon:yes gene_type:complete
MKLTEEQKQLLKDNKWNLIPNETGHIWIGSDTYSKTPLLSLVNEVLPLDESTGGYNFLIIAYQKEEDDE